MRAAWKYLRRISGAVLINRQMVKLLVAILGGCHVLLTALSVICHMPVMTWLNIGSFLFCIGCFIMARSVRKPQMVLYACYADVLFQVMAASVCMGFASGFCYHLLWVILHAYFASFCFRKEKYPLNLKCCILSCIAVFLLVWQWMQTHESLYVFMHNWTGSVISAVNFFVATCMMLLTMNMFLARVRLAENRLKDRNLELEELAKKDALTGLVNRRGLEECYQEFQQSQEKYAVIMGDIDDFKKINDRYGHNVGDQVLQRVAEVIQNAVRCNDVVCRWGGEEILIFLPECDEENAAKIAERVLERIRAVQVKFDGKHFFQFTMTLGVAGSMEGEDFHRAVDRADERLYQGKRSGKNCVQTESAVKKAEAYIDVKSHPSDAHQQPKMGAATDIGG